jgi:hypothetical protein
MIGLILLLMAVLHYSAPLARKWISTYLRKRNGSPKTGMEDNYVLLPLTMNLHHRLLYRPQLAADGNMKLVHQIQKRPKDDVSSSDGELFLVKRARYVEHLVHAPPRQPVSPHQIRVSS